jgi:geranylgeranyl reductase family protein
MTAYDSDVLVIGAGPSGSMAAREAARLGLSTLLVDRASFPRSKPCGDGLTMRATEILAEQGLADELFAGHKPLEKVRMWSPAGDLLEFTCEEDPAEFGYVIPRKDLDHFLWRKALDAGAHFRQARVADVTMDHSGVTATTDKGETLRAQYLILAAGGLSPLPVKLGFSGEFLSQAVAMRGYWENVGDLQHSEDVYLFPIRTAGYIWVFSEPGGLANVGLGIDRDDYKAMGKQLPELLRGWLRDDPRLAHRFKDAKELNLEGHVIPLGLRQGPLVKGRTLLVGDAAGVANPVTGEGISYGMATGIAAARAVEAAAKAGSLQPIQAYETATRKELEKKFRQMEIANGFLKHPEFTNYWFRLAKKKPELKARMQGFLRSPRRRGPRAGLLDFAKWMLLP